MRVTPFSSQGLGFTEVPEISRLNGLKYLVKENSTTCRSFEPTSVLDTRSPSPPPSSTLSALGGSTGSTDSAAVAAVYNWSSQSFDDPSSVATGGRDDACPKDEWVLQMQAIQSGLELNSSEKCGLGLQDLENMLSGPSSSPGQDQNILRWMACDTEGNSSCLKQVSPIESNNGGVESGFVLVDNPFGSESFDESLNTINYSQSFVPCGFTSISNSSNGRSFLSPNFPAINSKPPYIMNNSQNPQNPVLSPLTQSSTAFYETQFDGVEGKSLFYSNPVLNQQQMSSLQNSPLLYPVTYGGQDQHLQLLSHLKRTDLPFIDSISKPSLDSGQDPSFVKQQEFFHSTNPINRMQERMMTKVDTVGEDDEYYQKQSWVDQLCKAADLIEAGNSANARGILARLNQQISPKGKPLQRASFYLKEALQLFLINSVGNLSIRNPRIASSPLEIILRIDAHKSFSEISPLLQFTNFSCNQAILEVFEGFQRVHVVDFDVGFGGQWSSFMQELALRPGGPPLLKITAVTVPSSYDPLELSLTRENLCHFANNLNISFVFDVINLDSYDMTSSPLLGLHNHSGNEAIAVNFPVGIPTSASSIIRLVKHLTPRIVVCVDRGLDRSYLSFSHYILHSLKACTVLLDSIDSMNANSDEVHKIEQFFIQPRIKSAVFGRLYASEKSMPWKSLFPVAGFSPLPFSNFAETQADLLVKRLQVRGFHVQKSESSLVLCWQQSELISVSAWG